MTKQNRIDLRNAKAALESNMKKLETAPEYKVENLKKQVAFWTGRIAEIEGTEVGAVVEEKAVESISDADLWLRSERFFKNGSSYTRRYYMDLKTGKRVKANVAEARVEAGEKVFKD